MIRRILATWVGHTDLGAWSRNATLSAAHQEAVKKILKSKSQAEGIGPIKTLLEKEAFTQVHLIGDYDRSLLQQFSKWLKVTATIHTADIKNPTDHSKIYQIVDPILESMNLQRGDEVVMEWNPQHFASVRKRPSYSPVLTTWQDVPRWMVVTDYAIGRLKSTDGWD